MFGQHPQVGISNLPISPHILSTLVTEMDVNRCLGLEPDVPLEHATLPMSKRKSDSPNFAAAAAASTTTQTDMVQTTGEGLGGENNPPSSDVTTGNQMIRTTGSRGSNQLSRQAFTSLGFTTDRMDELVAKLIQKVTVKTPNGSYFGWKGLGFQCGVFFLSLSSHVNLNVKSCLMMTGGFSTGGVSTNMQLMDNASVGNLKSPPEELNATTPIKAPSTVRLLTSGDEQDFFPNVLHDTSKYEGDVRHAWLSLLLKMTQPTNSVTLENANIRSCFVVMDKESNLSDPWRRVILRRVRKTMWELLDEYGESVLEIVLHRGEKGVIDKWGKWFVLPLSKTTRTLS
jgi:hypothetical protein